MDSEKTKCMLQLVADILKHTQNVQTGISFLLENSALSFHQFLNERGLSADENVLRAYQFQDVMKQQITALNETIASSENGIRIYISNSNKDEEGCETINKLLIDIEKILDNAKLQQDDLSGNALNKKNHEEVEFF